MSIASALAPPSKLTRTTTFSVPCPAPRQTGPAAVGRDGSVREVFPDPDSLMCLAGVCPVSFQSGKLRNVTSAGPAIRFCATPSICGPMPLARPVLGLRLITRPNAGRDTLTSVRCVVWPNAGSNCFGACGATGFATTKPLISKVCSSTFLRLAEAPNAARSNLIPCE